MKDFYEFIKNCSGCGTLTIFSPNTVNGAGLGPVPRLTQGRGEDQECPVVYGSHA